MAFRKMTLPQYPPRMWSIAGYPGCGKSTFAARMRGPMVVIDADHRFSEVLTLAGTEVFALSDTPSDNVNPDLITRKLNENMPGTAVKTIVVDSLTAIITPLVVQAMLDNDKGKNTNMVASFRTKALAMRQLQDAVTRWGTDVLWIYHLQDARDGRAKEVVRASVSQTELARLTRSINLQLQIVESENKRGIHVAWARRGRSGMTLWDESTSWDGMPERVEEAVYAGLSRAEQDEIERATPELFPNSETAIAWGFEQGAFEALEHARNAYKKLKTDRNPQSAREMAAFWVAEVQERLTQVALQETEVRLEQTEAPF